MSKIAPLSQRRLNASNSRNLWGVFPYLITLFFTVFYFLNAARLDPEPHHDGYLLATAIGSKEGLLPHTEVFNQYGPVSSYILGLFLRLDFGPLLTIRLTIALILVLSALFVVAIMSEINHPVAGMLGVILWASTSPDWTVTWERYSFVGQWPWPNLIFTFFVLLSLLLFLCGMECRNVSQRFITHVFFSGLFMAVAVTTRTTLGILLILAIGIVFALSLYKKVLSVKFLSTFLLGFSTWVIIFITYLVFYGLVNAYLVDTIAGPANATSPSSPSVFLWAMVRPAIGAVVALAAIYLLYRVLTKYYPSEAVTVTLIATSITTFMFAAHEWLKFPKVLPAQLFIPWGKAGLFTAQVNIPLYLAFLATPIFSMFMFGKILRGSRSLENSLPQNELDLNVNNVNAVKMLLIGVTASSLLFGAYPIADLLHIWWSTPLALALLLALVSKIDLIKKNVIAFGLAAIFPFVLIGTTHSIKQNNVDRITLNSPALKGMLVSQNYYYDYMSANSFMKRHSDEDIIFMCDDGLFSIWNNYWQSSGPDFISWSWGPRTPIRSSVDSSIKSVIFCSNDPRETSILARAMGLTITDQARSPLYSNPTNRVTLSAFSQQYLFFAEYTGVTESEIELYDHPS